MLGCGLYPRGSHVHIDVRSQATIWVDLSGYGDGAVYVPDPAAWLEVNPAAGRRSGPGRRRRGNRGRHGSRIGSRSRSNNRTGSRSGSGSRTRSGSGSGSQIGDRGASAHEIAVGYPVGRCAAHLVSRYGSP
jgi:hypothetical protein